MKLVFVLIALLSLTALLMPSVLRWFIKRRLLGYVCHHNQVDESLPQEVQDHPRVAVIGAGVAGLTAATLLARRGFSVTLIEKNDYLGGKLGSFKVAVNDEEEIWVSHGFHAFFPHYHNLNRFLDSLALRKRFTSISDYVIMGRGGQVLRFANLSKTPVFNLISLMRAGMFSLKDALKAPGRDMYGVFLEYDQKQTFADFDHLSYARFSEIARVPPRLKLAFNTFARAFFADEEKLSFAELIKSFHFYYLSHDGGLLYDYPLDDYEEGLLCPLREELASLGAEIRLSTPVARLSQEGAFFRVDDEPFDHVIVAADARASGRLVGQAEGLPRQLRERFVGLKAGQRYAILRVWLDRDVRDDVPIFVITEKEKVLDSVTTYHRFEKQTQTAVSASTGSLHESRSVLELHCYSVPDDMPDEAVKKELLSELFSFFPELQGAKVLGEHFQLRDDFTAFHVGLDAERPGVKTGVPGLYCAGDWVKVPLPAMLLECACVSGVLSANEIFKSHGLREEAVLSVPQRGLMAGFPPPPGRKPLLDER